MCLILGNVLSRGFCLRLTVLPENLSDSTETDVGLIKERDRFDNRSAQFCSHWEVLSDGSIHRVWKSQTCQKY